MFYVEIHILIEMIAELKKSKINKSGRNAWWKENPVEGKRGGRKVVEGNKVEGKRVEGKRCFART